MPDPILPNIETRYLREYLAQLPLGPGSQVVGTDLTAVAGLMNTTTAQAIIAALTAEAIGPAIDATVTGSYVSDLEFAAEYAEALPVKIGEKTDRVVRAIDFMPKDDRAAILAGTSVNDHSIPFQKFLNAESANAVFEVRGTYNVKRPQWGNKTYCYIDGVGGELIVIGDTSDQPDPESTKNGLQLIGVINQGAIFGLRIICDGVVENRHAGIFSNSGVQVTGLDIYHVYVKDGINGASLNSNLSGFYKNCRVFLCEIDGTVGLDSGYGYGLHCADGSSGDACTQIFLNTIRAATRHSIYHARGRKGSVRNNLIIDHRLGVADGSIRSAINCLRSGGTDVSGNILINPNDGGIYIGKSGIDGVGNSATGNVFYQVAASNAVPLLMVGSQNPAAIDPDIPGGATVEGAPSNTIVENNKFFSDGNMCDFIRIYCGMGVKVKNNTGWRVNLSAPNLLIQQRAIFVYGVGGDTYNADYDISGNSFDAVGVGSVIGWQAAILGSTIKIDVSRNSGNSLAMFSGTPPNNPNIRIFDQETAGLAMAAGVFANGRYQVKNVTATYDPASLATLTSLGANFSVPLAKKGDPCVAGFPEISSSNVLLSAQANSDNNVRVVFFNGGATTVDLPTSPLNIIVFVNR